jgi:hypothetical protein
MDSMMVMYRRSIICWFLSLPCGIISLLKPGSMDIICGRAHMGGQRRQAQW